MVRIIESELAPVQESGAGAAAGPVASSARARWGHRWSDDSSPPGWT